MRIERRYTKDGQSPYADIQFRLTTSEIKSGHSQPAALTDGFQRGFLVGAVFAIVGAAVTLLVIRAARQEVPEGEPELVEA